MNLLKTYKEPEFDYSFRYTEISENIYATTFNGNIINIFVVNEYRGGIKYAKCILGTPHILEFELNEDNTK